MSNMRKLKSEVKGKNNIDKTISKSKSTTTYDRYGVREINTFYDKFIKISGKEIF